MTENNNPLAEAFAAANFRRQAAETAEAEFRERIPLLTDILKQDTGSSYRAAAVICSLWNGELCDALCGNDNATTQALMSAIRYRALAEGNADEALRPIADLATDLLPERHSP